MILNSITCCYLCSRYVFGKLYLFVTSFLVLIIIFFSSPAPINGQIINRGNGTVKGVVVDSLTKQAVEYANFILYKLKDSTLMKGAVTDSTGRFILESVSEGTYFARLSVVGYRARKRDNLTINSTHNMIDLDTIRLVPKSLSTTIVNVTAKKEKVIFENDKIIINVDRSFGLNASDVLENTPMVKVDIEGNISLLGNPGPVIYIDGIPARYSGINSSDDLKLISSSDIDKIELVLNPSVEYMERSDGGIINIILKKKSEAKISGYAGIIGDTKNRLNSNIGLSFRYKSVFTRGSYVNNYSKYKTLGRFTRTVSLDEGTNILGQSSEAENKTGSNRMVFILGFNPDKDNTLNAMCSYYAGKTDIKKLLNSQEAGDKVNGLDNFESENLTGSSQKFITYSLMYNKRFPEKGRSFSAMVSSLNNFMDMDNKVNKRILYMPEFPIMQHNTSGNTNNSLIWNFSYVHPLFSGLKLSSGYSGELKKLAMDNLYNNSYAKGHKYIELPAQRIRSEYYDIRNSILSDITGTFWSVNFNAGIALGKFHLENEEVISGNNFSNSFTSITPSVGLRKEILKDHTISLGYSRRTSYPENRQLNPRIDYSDSANISMGNPNLKPSYSSSFNFGYEAVKKDFFLRAGVSYCDMKDIIEEVTTQGNLRTAITTYKNIASSSSIEGYLYINKTFSDFLTVEPMIRLYQTNYNGNSINSRSFSWNTGLVSGASISKLKARLELMFASPLYTSQSKSKAAYYTNASIKALFFDKQLSLTLRVQDIFNTLNKDRNIYGTGFFSYSSIREPMRVVSLGISYYFQSKAEDTIDEPEVSEEFDDF